MTTQTTSRKQLNDFVSSYILNAIDGEGYDKELNTDTEKLQFLADCFKGEYMHPNALKFYKTYQECFRQWIMGLPSSFNIDFENYRIIEIAKEWGSLDNNSPSRKVDNILTNWFNFIAAKTLQLMAKHNITVY
jgi:hypothetical protein